MREFTPDRPLDSCRAPTLPPQSDRHLGLLESLEVHNAASDPDIPANGLTYQLTESPDGATIDSTGTIRWTPPLLGLLPGAYRFTTVVTDNGSPALNAMNSFLVYVAIIQPPLLNIQLTDTNSVIVSWPADYTGWQLQQTASFDNVNWTDVNNPVVLAWTNTIVIGTNGIVTELRQEYQVTISPLTDHQFFRLRQP